ncbi:MAG: hypothetical protein M3Q10_13960 [Chloroflexota bacterium]|nr:hypothetical protein [Chloroflexota bacterium]
MQRFDADAGRNELPANGIYLFFEHGEAVLIDGLALDRIVRVGTHKADGRFPGRIRDHYRGNRRASVFRRHLGAALLNRDHPGTPRLQTWLAGPRTALPEIEEWVGDVLRERFGFACLRVDQPGERLALERGLIALLAQHQIATPSSDWLGRHATHAAIRRTGLWNTQHVDAPPLSPAESDKVIRLIGEGS